MDRKRLLAVKKISAEQQARLKEILGDLELHMEEIDKMKERLREKRVSFFTPQDNQKMLEEIVVPPLQLLREDRAKKPAPV